MDRINRKIIAASALLTVFAFATIMGGILAVRANTNSTSDANTDTITADGIQSLVNGQIRPDFGGGMMPGRRGGDGGHGQVQVSEEYEQNVINIAKNDTDVQKLLAEGYNITLYAQ